MKEWRDSLQQILLLGGYTGPCVLGAPLRESCDMGGGGSPEKEVTVQDREFLKGIKSSVHLSEQLLQWWVGKEISGFGVCHARA